MLFSVSQVEELRHQQRCLLILSELGYKAKDTHGGGKGIFSQ